MAAATATATGDSIGVEDDESGHASAKSALRPSTPSRPSSRSSSPTKKPPKVKVVLTDPDGEQQTDLDGLGAVPEPSRRKCYEVLLRDTEPEAPLVEPSASDPPPYGHTTYGPAYWDARHSFHSDFDEPFDWYMDYDRLAPVLHERLPHPDSQAMPEILEVGFGCSEVISRLYRHGWRNLIGIDFSMEAVMDARAAQRHANKPELQFLQMDACRLGFPDNCFHAVLDKALFDTLVSDGHALPKATRYLNEVYRVLRPDGVFFLVSHAGVGARLPWLVLRPEVWKWRIEVSRISKPPPTCLGDATENVKGFSHSEHYHVYIMTKPEAPHPPA